MSEAKLLAPGPGRGPFPCWSPGLRAVCPEGRDTHCGPGLGALVVQLREAPISWGLGPESPLVPPHLCLISLPSSPTACLLCQEDFQVPPPTSRGSWPGWTPLCSTSWCATPTASSPPNPPGSVHSRCSWSSRPQIWPSRHKRFQAWSPSIDLLGGARGHLFSLLHSKDLFSLSG